MDFIRIQAAHDTACIWHVFLNMEVIYSLHRTHFRILLFFLPALLTRMSIFSSVSQIFSAHSLTEASDPRSSFMKTALPLLLPNSALSPSSSPSLPTESNSSTAASPLCWFLAKTMTLAPRPTRSLAVSLPMPAVAPVMTIVWIKMSISYA